MDVKSAVQVAVQYMKDLFASEQITNLGLEEVEYDDHTNDWIVTIGFSRPWDYPQSSILPGIVVNSSAPPKRAYKTVIINDGTEKILSVKNREIKL